MQRIFHTFLILLFFYVSTFCSAVKVLSGEERGACIKKLGDVTSQTRGSILDRAWLTLNRMERAEAVENIARVEGEVLSADEVLTLTTTGDSGSHEESKNELVSCTATLLVHDIEKLWEFLPELEREEILYEIASAL